MTLTRVYGPCTISGLSQDTVDSKKLEYEPEAIFAGVPSSH